jgi:hypothetical protein
MGGASNTWIAGAPESRLPVVDRLPSHRHPHNPLLSVSSIAKRRETISSRERRAFTVAGSCDDSRDCFQKLFVIVSCSNGPPAITRACG